MSEIKRSIVAKVIAVEAPWKGKESMMQTYEVHMQSGEWGKMFAPVNDPPPAKEGAVAAFSTEVTPKGGIKMTLHPIQEEGGGDIHRDTAHVRLKCLEIAAGIVGPLPSNENDLTGHAFRIKRLAEGLEEHIYRTTNTISK